MFAVEMFCDHPLEDFVKEMWIAFHHQAISSYMYDIEEIRPHITLAVYNEVQATQMPVFHERFYHFFQHQRQVEIQCDSIGIFPVTGTCYLAPTVTQELLQLHAAFHNRFEGYRYLSNPYYTPGRWTPHCTLATQLHQDKVVEAVQYSLSRFRPIRAQIVEIGLVEIIFEEAKCVRSRTVASVPLAN